MMKSSLSVTLKKVVALPLGENVAHSVRHLSLKMNRVLRGREKIECSFIFVANYLNSSQPEHTPTLEEMAPSQSNQPKSGTTPQMINVEIHI